MFLKNEAATEQLGAAFAKKISPGFILFLKGELGSGKTTFVRGFLRGLGYEKNVKSPTYTLIEEYDFSHFEVYHFDLYRVLEAEELTYIGIEDYFHPKSIVLIEWPEHGQGVLPPPSLTLEFKTIPKKEGREVTIEAFSPSSQTLIESLSL